MSQESFETIVSGVTLEVEPCYEDLVPRAGFPHLDPNSYLWDAAVCLQKDCLGLKDVPTAFGDRFDEAYSDKSPELVDLRWEVFTGLYQAIGHRLEKSSADGGAAGNRYHQAVNESFHELFIHIELDETLSPDRTQDLQKLTLELITFYLTEPQQNFHDLLD